MFSYNGVTQTYTVPANVMSIEVQLWGGGGAGGYFYQNNGVSTTPFGGGAGISN